MKKLKIFAFVSIDGYSSRINGDIDWVPSPNSNPFDHYGMPEFLETIDTIVMNRMQNILLQSHSVNWPIADKTCYVLSYRGQPLAPPVKSVSGLRSLTVDDTRGPLERIRDIQLVGGRGDVWVMGDHRLTAYLLQYDMIDEINIVRLPVLLGSGLSFFGDFGIETHWQVENYNKYDNGAILTRYCKSLIEIVTA